MTFEKNNEFSTSKNMTREFVNFIWKIKDPNYESCKLKIIDFIAVFYLNQNIQSNCETSTLNGEVINIVFENQQLSAEDRLYYNMILSENYSAEEVMDFYYRNVKFEKEIKGFLKASKYYFDKSINELNMDEQIKLIAISELVSAEIPEENYDKELNLKMEYIKSQLEK